MYVDTFYGWSIFGNEYKKWIKIVAPGEYLLLGEGREGDLFFTKYQFMLFKFCTIYVSTIKISMNLNLEKKKQ